MVAIIGADWPLAPCRYLDSNQNTVINAGGYTVGSVGITVVGGVVVDINTVHFCICPISVLLVPKAC